MGLGGNINLPTQVNTVPLEQAIQRYVHELGLEGPKIVKQVFRLIIRDVMSITAPKQNAQGRKAVQRDINKAVYMLDPSKVKRKTLRQAILDREYDIIRIILSRTKAGRWKNVQVVPFNPSLHTSVRDRRGRVPRSKNIVTPDVREHKKYVRMIQGHVGYTRAGWAPAARMAGATVPGWVSRHQSPPGTAKDDTSNKVDPRMTAIHDGRTTSNLPRDQISKVIVKRAAAMRRDVDQILGGRASRYFK